MTVTPIYRKTEKVQHAHLGSCDVYYMNPRTQEKGHYHAGIEIVYVIKGNCQTHHQGKTYVYQPGEIHGVINNSDEELVFVCLQIPPESESNTVYIEK